MSATPSALETAPAIPTPSASRKLDPIRVQAKFFFEGDRKFFVKGVTYGPFKPDAAGDFVGTAERARQDLRLMGEMGFNVIRVYHVPPRWFLDACEEFGMRVLVTIPWAEHVEFLRDRKIRGQIVETIRAAVRKNCGHAAIFGYLVGNEIPTTMVRWLGVRQVTEFVESLINVARKVDPRALYSYASYPSTEYLLPQNVDFCCFNVYLHRQDEFERYLARLQNLAEDRPLMLGEFGMDTIRHTEEEQAEMIGWHVDSVVRGGLAGTVIFAWTDEWFTGGHEITDWAFGVVTRDRKPKKAFFTLQEKFAGDAPVTRRVKLRAYPKVSVIVCSYNGGRTLQSCLESLLEVDYPDYEIVLVDDGSTDDTPEAMGNFLKRLADGASAEELAPKPVPGESGTTIQSAGRLRYVRQKNMGLSYARNLGARVASGEIFAYTDSDCMADPDWLYYLVCTLLSGEYAGVGGPNVSPPAEDWIQACVSGAPGGPSHVLLTDVVAEHIPGCNMAFHRWAFDMVGGFDVDYRKAGDDVDFCWRLQSDGQIIAFSPAAIVWHYRRFTLTAFRKQQEGYGEAESLLRFKHLIFFAPTGTAKWKGQIYGAPRFTWLINKPIVYHGVFGQGLFQSIYPTPQSEIAAYVSSIEWVVLTALIFLLSIPLPIVRIVPYVMFGGTFLVALSYMMHARLEPRFDTIPARLLVMWLALLQPLVRGWSRYFTWLKFKRTPESVIQTPEQGFKRKRRWNLSRLSFWNEKGVGREKLLEEMAATLETEGWRYSTDTGWKDWDFQIYGNFWWILTLNTVTEYHGGPKCLTRVQLRAKPVITTGLANLAFILLSTYQLLHKPILASWMLLVYAAFLAYLGYRSRRLKRRVVDLVEAAAIRCELQRLLGRKVVPA